MKRAAIGRSLHAAGSARLPLWGRVVFVDWNGVMCRDPFWHTILENERHPYRERVAGACDSLFGESKDVVRAWMRGILESEDIIKDLDVQLDGRARQDYLLRRLFADCGRMRCDPELVAALRSVREHCFVVLATDNMDCFVDRLHRIRDLSSVIDAVLCSSSLGVLKSDGVERFFGRWLTEHQLTFRDALLLDDCAETCCAFREAGGEAVLVSTSGDAVDGLVAWVTGEAGPGEEAGVSPFAAAQDRKSGPHMAGAGGEHSTPTSANFNPAGPRFSA